MLVVDAHAHGALEALDVDHEALGLEQEGGRRLEVVREKVERVEAAREVAWR